MEKRHLYNTLNSKNGFTLIEILIVILIFSIGILGLSAMQFSAAKGNIITQRLSEATAVASSQLESLLSANYSDPILASGTHRFNIGIYSITYEVTELIDNKVKKISLLVKRPYLVERTDQEKLSKYELIITNIP